MGPPNRSHTLSPLPSHTSTLRLLSLRRPMSRRFRSHTRFQLPRPSELARRFFTPETRSSRLRRPTTLMFRSHTRSPLTRSSTSPTLTSLDTPTTEPMALTPVRTTETSHPTGTSDLVDTSDATPATSQTAMATELVCLPELLRLKFV